MRAVKPCLISTIDAYAEKTLALSADTLMNRAGEALFRFLQTKLHKKNPRVLIVCGGGNNGGDGYALGRLLLENGARVTAVDLFSKGQASRAGQNALDAYLRTPYAELSHGTAGVAAALSSADCVVEAVFGVGARADLPEEAVWLFSAFREEKEKRIRKGQNPPLFISVDCPLGIDAENGRAREDAFAFDATVELSFPKIGTHSYPAARYAGAFFMDTLGLPIAHLSDNYHLQDIIMDEAEAKAMLPKRDPEGHKGTFGTLGAVTGSARYRGACLLSAEAALRGGIGLLRCFGEKEVCDVLVLRTPEAVCHPIKPLAAMTEAEAEAFVSASPRVSAYLIGSGCGQSEGLANLLRALLASDGAPLVLDADALNVLSDRRYALLPLLAESKRQALLTPHPLEFARLADKTVEEVQVDRMALARAFAAQYGVTLLLKGKGSLTAAPNGRIAVNPSGNTALSKGGSGDVLAGLVASYVAQGLSPFEAAALGAYLHGRAAETLAITLGEAGVTPSDLPLAIAKETRSILNIKS